MCKVPVKLRELVKQRLAAAAEEIFELLEKTITEYEEELRCVYEKQKNPLETDLNQIVVYGSVVPETPDPAALPTSNVVPDAAHVFEETPEPERVQIINALEQLQSSVDASLFKEEQQSVLISSVVLSSAVKDEQAEVSTFSLDSLKQEEFKEEPNLITFPETAPEPPQTDSNENGHEEDECENWEFEGLSGPENTEQTENSSEEELLPLKKRPTLTDVLQNSNNVSLKPSEQTEAAERDRATVSYAVSNKAASSEEKTENSSDASESEDKSGKNSNQNCDENRGELPINVIRLKDFKIVGNQMNFEIDKGQKIAIPSGNIGLKRKRKRRKKKTDKMLENDQSESDSGGETLNHECPECSRTFSSLQKLKVHATAHKGNTLSCSVCEKKFKAKHFLKRHVNVHKAQSATTMAKNSDDKFSTKQKKKHDGETDTDKTEDSSDEN